MGSNLINKEVITMNKNIKYKPNPNWTKKEQERIYNILLNVLPMFKWNTFTFRNPYEFHMLIGTDEKLPENLSKNLRDLSARFPEIWVEVKPKQLELEYEVGLPPF